MHVLAEIADKMPGIATIWGVLGLLALPFAAVAIRHRRAAIATLPCAVAMTSWLVYGAYNEVFLDASFGDAIRRELGWTWIASAMLAPLLPTAVVLVVIYVQWRRAPTAKRGFEPVLRGTDKSLI